MDAGAVTITEADLAWRVGVMAHDSMQGRDTPSEGLEKTAAWIASQFREMGLRGGAAEGAYLQRYPLRATAFDVEASYARTDAVSLELGSDLLPLVADPFAGEASGRLLVASGTRGVVPTVANDAVRGSHVLLVLEAGAPGITQDVYRRLSAIMNAGARSVLVTNDADDAVWRSQTAAALRPSVSRAWVDQAPRGGEFRPLLQIRAASAAALLGRPDIASLQRRTGDGLDFRLEPVEGGELSIRIAVADSEITAPNVVGVLDGSDPTLREEYVVFSAHMDHIGVGSPDQNGDTIFNGADDDASGTATVIEIAQGMASLPTPPRRSMIFLLVSGEEKGLWGSEYYSNNPTAPADRLVADLNVDMVGRNWTDTIVAIGREHSDLGETLERVNDAHPELGMTAIDDLWPEERFYFRSDHYNFARRGVPILFFFNGTHEDYHGRDDEPDRIDAEKAARVAKLIFYLGLEIANRDDRPAWDPQSRSDIVTDPPR